MGQLSENIMQSAAFVGVSLDSDEFTREWVRQAISYILSKHSRVVFVLADRLLGFNKDAGPDETGNMVLNLETAAAKIAKRRNDVQLFLKSEVSRLEESDRRRASIAAWDEYADAEFANIERILKIAYAALPRFRECVDRDVEAHLAQQGEWRIPQEVYRRLCALYVVEETAMIIRITEDGNPYEYYPHSYIHTLRDVYDDRFADLGLTVESLVGHPRTRVFTPLQFSSSLSA
jgi:hypothetical protein